MTSPPGAFASRRFTAGTGLPQNYERAAMLYREFARTRREACARLASLYEKKSIVRAIPASPQCAKGM